MRGNLTEEARLAINEKIPTIDRRIMLATFPGLVTGAHDLLNDKFLSTALECLSDARKRFQNVQTALFEAYACIAWYRELSPNKPKELEAVSSGKFFLDYVTLLLYATAEDISFFIIHFLDIADEVEKMAKDPVIQKQLAKRKISSNAGKVGFYLAKNARENEITKAVLTLHNNTNWKQAINYRNAWVHDKPPIIHGLGIEFSRKKHVVQDENGKRSMFMGGGTEPQFTIDELADIVQKATTELAECLSTITNIVIREREALGEVFDFDNGRITVRLDSSD